MKMKDLRELTVEELGNKQDALWADLFGMRIKHALGQLENPLQLRSVRRDIARVKTLLTQHGVAETSRRRRHAAAPRTGAGSGAKKARKAAAKK
jgi:large subunit ribosomal protein L29